MVLAVKQTLHSQIFCFKRYAARNFCKSLFQRRAAVQIVLSLPRAAACHRSIHQSIHNYTLSHTLRQPIQKRPLSNSKDSYFFKDTADDWKMPSPESKTIDEKPSAESKRTHDAASANPSETSGNGTIKKPKLSKNEAGKNHTRRSWFDSDRNDRDIPKSTGSYAHEDQQTLFGIKDIDDKKVVFPDDTKTVKRKVAMLLGFLGTEYGGFQINVGQRTLQAEIELALYRAGMLSKMNFGNPHKYSWSSSARTDKGVHACAQVCSLKVELLETDLEDTSLNKARERLQERLPLDIQCLQIARTTRNFCAKTQR